MSDIGYVYGLFDPAEQVIRYVGQSYKPRVRLSTHQTLNDKNRNTPPKQWIAAMLQEGRYPCMIILQACSLDDVLFAEFDWYQRLEATGTELHCRKLRPSGFAEYAPESQRLHSESKYAPLTVIEAGVGYRVYTPDEPAYRQKYTDIMEFAKNLPAIEYASRPPKSRTLRVGQEFVGMAAGEAIQVWTVTEIQRDKITLTKADGETVRLLNG